MKNNMTVFESAMVDGYVAAFDAKLDDAWKLLEEAYAIVDKMELSEPQRDILKVRLDVARYHITDAADRANDMIGMKAWVKKVVGA